MSQAISKSRLGLLLIRKGLINQQQLDNALKIQFTTGKRLGEALIEQGCLTERQLQKALKKQSRHRFIAAMVAMILGPMSFGAFAGQSSSSQQQEQSSSAQMNHYPSLRGGLKALDDSALDDVQGQGSQSQEQAIKNLLAKVQGEETGNDNPDQISELGPLNDIMDVLNPLSSMIDSEMSVKGVKYNSQNPRQVLHEDGSMEFTLPSEIEEIAFKNIRVKGAPVDQSFGSVVISGIRFSEQSRITIRVNN